MTSVADRAVEEFKKCTQAVKEMFPAEALKETQFEKKIADMEGKTNEEIFPLLSGYYAMVGPMLKMQCGKFWDTAVDAQCHVLLKTYVTRDTPEPEKHDRCLKTVKAFEQLGLQATKNSDKFGEHVSKMGYIFPSLLVIAACFKILNDNEEIGEIPDKDVTVSKEDS